MSHTVRGKVFVVMGGTTGLGLSGARALIQAGAAVVAVGRNPENVEAARQELAPAAHLLAGDATDPATATKAVEAAVRQFGALHGLYHVAGGSGRSQGDGPLHQITDQGWEHTLGLNLTSLFYSNRAAVQYFLEKKIPGSILNMTSVLGFSPAPAHFATHAYAAAKAAIIGLTKSSAAYYAPRNIRFNALAPALVETPMSRRAQQNPEILEFISKKQPLDGGRIGRPADLDAAVLFFLSDDSAFATGQVLSVDGGWTVSG